LYFPLTLLNEIGGEMRKLLSFVLMFLLNFNTVSATELELSDVIKTALELQKKQAMTIEKQNKIEQCDTSKTAQTKKDIDKEEK
jgi:hypothetical protein